MQTHTYENRKLYRARDGMIFGVCKGIANYTQISVAWIRVLTIMAVLVTAFWPIALLYIATAIFLKVEPAIKPLHDEDWEFYEEYVTNKKWALARLKRRFDNLEKRTRRMESVVTDREYDWERRFRSST